MNLKLYSKLILASLLFLNATVACNQSLGEKYDTPEGYELNNPYKEDLPTPLDEISGIVYLAKDSAIFAISDESGNLFKYYPQSSKPLEKWKITKNSDFEDLQLIDSVFYLISSKGDITTARFYSADSIDVQTFEFKEKGKYEFESSFLNPAKKDLTLICKNCKGDDKNSVSAWDFNLDTKEFKKSDFKIDVKNIEDILKTKKLEFRPSAAAIHPITGDLYIISSIGKIFVIAGIDGKIKSAQFLKSSFYKQPEGLTFTPSGGMIITNEYAGEGSAEILAIKYKEKNK